MNTERERIQDVLTNSQLSGASFKPVFEKYLHDDAALSELLQKPESEYQLPIGLPAMFLLTGYLLCESCFGMTFSTSPSNVVADVAEFLKVDGPNIIETLSIELEGLHDQLTRKHQLMKEKSDELKR